MDQSDPLGADPSDDWSGLSLREVTQALKERVSRMQATRTPVTKSRGRRKLWGHVGEEVAVRAIVFA